MERAGGGVGADAAVADTVAEAVAISARGEIVREGIARESAVAVGGDQKNMVSLAAAAPAPYGYATSFCQISSTGCFFLMMCGAPLPSSITSGASGNEL